MSTDKMNMETTKPTVTSVLGLLAASDAPLLRADIGAPPTALLKNMEAAGLVISAKVISKEKKRGRPPFEYSLTEDGKAAAANPSYVLPDAPKVAARPAPVVTVGAVENEQAVRARQPKPREAQTPRTRATIQAQQRVVTDTAPGSDEKLTLVSVTNTAGYLEAEVKLLGDTFNLDKRYGTWQFNDPFDNGQRKFADHWVAAYLQANASKALVNA